MPDKINFAIKDVTISEDGRVIIANRAFAQELLKRLKKDPGSVGIFDNCSCQKDDALAMLTKVRDMGPGRVGIFDNCDCKGKLTYDVRRIRTLGIHEINSVPDFDIQSPVGIFDNCNC
ncbi:MAG: hypothetical protein IH599_05240 [Bacteroidales bacterium]|jgi:hypothetical protein|nr:hypothetical protein [Bacteroidales bacterium]